MFSIDLPAMVPMLQQLNYSGTLVAHLPLKALGIKGNGYARLGIFKGKIIACTIWDNQGRELLADREAIEMITKTGTVDWVTEKNSGSASTTFPIPTIQTTPSTSKIPISPEPGPQTPQPDFWKNTGAMPPITPDPRTTDTFRNTYSTSELTSSYNQPTGAARSTNESLKGKRFDRYSIPYKIVHLNTLGLNALPRQCSRAFVAVDGQRTVHQIISLLTTERIAETEIIDALLALLRQNYISF